jgi:hypothetical protein
LKEENNKKINSKQYNEKKNLWKKARERKR